MLSLYGQVTSTFLKTHIAGDKMWIKEARKTWPLRGVRIWRLQPFIQLRGILKKKKSVSDSYRLLVTDTTQVKLRFICWCGFFVSRKDSKAVMWLTWQKTLEAWQVHLGDQTGKIKAASEIITGQLYILVVCIRLQLSAKGFHFCSQSL